MPTTKREIYDEALCHIVQRGNNKQTLFKERHDFEKFLSLIKDYKSICPFELYNYCIMRNHIHLLMKIVKGRDLAKIVCLQKIRYITTLVPILQSAENYIENMS